MASDVQRGLDAARDHLLARQAEPGWWKGELRTNVTMDAEDLLLRQFLGILRADELEAAARWIRSQQRPDGTWATFYNGPGDLSTTIEAYVALRLAGDDVDDEHLRIAREFILAQGGIEASRVFTRIWLALFGEFSWDDLPSMPPEVVLLPSWAPMNPYDFGCWARQTVVPITVVATLRPVRPLPFALDELHTDHRGPGLVAGVVGTGFNLLDKALKVYDRAPVKPGRSLALRQAAEWIIARQEDDGGWGGIQPPWVYSILALHLLGYPIYHPVLAKAIAGLDTFLVHEDTPDGPVRWLEACQSPVWDTCLAITALLDAGVTADDPQLRRSIEWILGEEIAVRGDWSVKRPELPAGGWAFEFANDGYPDIDDTAEVVLALDRVTDSVPEAKAAVDRGLAWVRGMQSKDGGWGAFDADNTRRLVEKLPFSDFGAVIDPPSADVTAHAVEMLAHCGDPGDPALQRGVRWLLDSQEPDGSWFGRWGSNYVYGTGAVVPALVAAGIDRDDAVVRRAIEWLAAHQNADGGWGEDLRSYVDDDWRGRGESTPSQTAWALLALLAAGEADSEMTGRGVAWLLEVQRDDGGWDEDQYTGTGFPGDFYISYEMYRLVFPISALGRYVRLTDGADAVEPV
ncbi:squalene--hopene cyclase [Jatrophihabitans endophyticus]|uniref:squalene--hopene cyclase n=1 Tax=Jatrophihabitans endophyticus TaxID=1206085 RepID=UPI0019DE058B|nr:squalene--hopene cyclase [Jatrophihabitans endophyticus]MBE7187774.1 squalene--hopene cyclase [Jatrophihabitans endophyticus]